MGQAVSLALLAQRVILPAEAKIDIRRSIYNSKHHLAPKVCLVSRSQLFKS
jgi:hypothetical protein